MEQKDLAHLSPMAAQFALSYSMHKQGKATRVEALSAQAADAVVKKSPLNDVPGLGATAIAKLYELGINSVASLIASDEAVLKKALNPVTLKQVKSFVKKANGQDSQAAAG